MTSTADVPGPVELPAAGPELDTLLGALDRNRRTFAWKVFGLPTEEMQRTLGPSTVTLAGLAKHVALVEDYYFSLGLGEVMPQPWRDVDFDADPDWEWHTATDDSAEELQALWQAAVDSLAGGDRRVPRRRLGRLARQLDAVGRAAEPAPDAGRHGGGVRPAHRPRGPDPRVDRRAGR